MLIRVILISFILYSSVISNDKVNIAEKDYNWLFYFTTIFFILSMILIYRQILLLNNVGIAEYDIKNEKFIYPKETIKLLGLNEKFNGSKKELYSYMHPDDIFEYSILKNKIKQSEKSFYIEFRIKQKNGNYRWFSAKCTKIGKNIIKGFISDITEKKELEESNRLLNLLNQTQKVAKIGSWEHNVIDNSVWYSDEVFNLYEIPKNTTPSVELTLSLLHPEDKDKLIKIIERTHKYDDIHNAKFRLITPKGNLKYISIHWKNSFDENGNILTSAGITRDITEKVLAREKIKEQRVILLQQSHLALQGEMLNMIAHQWRQPLNQLSLLIQIIFQKLNKTSKLTNDFKDYENEAIEIIKHLSYTISDFKEFFNENKEKEEFILKNLILDSLKIIDRRVEELRVTLKINENNLLDTVIYSYKSELAQVLIAILNNALDALKEKDTQRVIEILTYKIESGIEISISDNAGGIKDEILPKIFEPYFSTKKEKNGTGLGLYMSKMIIEKSIKGKLKVKSYDNKAIFEIILSKDIIK